MHKIEQLLVRYNNILHLLNCWEKNSIGVQYLCICESHDKMKYRNGMSALLCRQTNIQLQNTIVIVINWLYYYMGR